MSHVRRDRLKCLSAALLLSLALSSSSCGIPAESAWPIDDALLGAQTSALIVDTPLITDVQGAVCPMRGGCEVTVLGRRFKPALSTLWIGGKPATPCREVTSSRMICTVPAGPDGRASLEVRSALGGVSKSHQWSPGFWYLGNELPLWPVRTLSLAAIPKATAVADLNGDGHNDIAVIYHGRDGVQVFLGQPGGRSWSAPLDFATGRGPSAIAVADFDQDGMKTYDLIITNELEHSFTRLVGVKASPMAPYTPVTTTVSLLGSHPCIGPNQIVAQNLNLDNWPDLVINCSGGSPSMIAFTNSATSPPMLVHSDTAYTPGGTTRITPVHANSDMTSDMIVWGPGPGYRYPLTEHGRDAYLLRYNNKSLYGVIALGTAPLSTVGSGDFNGDQMIDFLGLTDTKEIWVIAASKMYDWLPNESVKSKLRTREAYQRLLSTDMNGDGLLDIIAHQPPAPSMATADIFLGDGAFGFSAGTPVSMGFPIPATDFADVDGDGYPDLLMLGADTPYSDSDDDGKTLQIVFSQRGTIPSLASISEVGTGTSALADYDVNGDGIRDLAVLNYNPGELHTLLGNSAGEFDPASPSRIIQFKDMTGPIVADAMDLNPMTTPPMLAVLHSAPDPAKGADMVTLLDHDMAGSIFKERPTRITLRTTGDPRVYSYTGISAAKFEDMDRDDHVTLSRRATMSEAGSLDVWTFKMMSWKQDMQVRSTDSADPSSVHLFSLDGMMRPARAITLSETDNKLSILAKGDNKPSRVYSTGPAPSAVTSCHIDSDMRVDLVVASADADQVSVFLDPLNGGAPARIDVPVCAQPRFVWCGDLNSDKNNDLLVGCGGHGSPATPTLEVLYGGGNRSFHRSSDAAPRPGTGGPIAVIQDAVAGLRIVAASHDGVLWTFLPGR